MEKLTYFCDEYKNPIVFVTFIVVGVYGWHKFQANEEKLENVADPKSKIYTSTDMDEHGRPVLVITPSCQQYLLQKPDVCGQFWVYDDVGYWVMKIGALDEVSVEMLTKLEVPWVILGHSERRFLLHETNEVVANKVAHALFHDKVVDWTNIILAYEPVWAVETWVDVSPA
uniref:triosephosphate isomerase, cytosolic-like n=1 Tax=Fragaria vesca subsp. vesca TaxID=101020 RepID=UPI0005CA784B|nr:PREDICTED: triosephosphate isomerase, cytosolic-like [Fragaria vesca subsp. vesca]